MENFFTMDDEDDKSVVLNGMRNDTVGIHICKDKTLLFPERYLYLAKIGIQASTWRR